VVCSALTLAADSITSVPHFNFMSPIDFFNWTHPLTSDKLILSSRKLRGRKLRRREDELRSSIAAQGWAISSIRTS
jgi:hypothetical protein